MEGAVTQPATKGRPHNSDVSEDEEPINADSRPFTSDPHIVDGVPRESDRAADQTLAGVPAALDDVFAGSAMHAKPSPPSKVAGATGDVERGRTFALRSPSICTWRTLRRICAPRSRCYAISYGADTGRTLHDGARGRMMPDGFCGRPDYLQFGEV